MDRLKEWLAEGLILVPTVLLLGLILFTLSFRLGQLTNIAEFLPEETEAFLMINREDYLASGSPVQMPFLNEYYGRSFESLSWLGRDIGLAKIDGHSVQILEINSSEDASFFFTSLFQNSTQVTSVLDEDVFCFEAEALCYRIEGDLLFSSSSEEALDAIAEKTNLEDSPIYQNMRSRLGHLESAFIYVDLQQNKKEFAAWLSEQGIREPLFLDSILSLFPAWGASIRMENNKWITESFTSVSKDKINGAYFHPNQKYEQKFLPWTRPFAWEWGTQDLAGQIQRMQEIFETWGSSSELIFSSTLNELTAKLLKSAESKQLLSLLDGENYFGWTSAEDFLFIIELNAVEDAQILQTLKSNYAQNTESQMPFVMALISNAAIIAANEELLLATLDAQMDESKQRDLSEIEVLLPGSDEIWIFNGAFLAEEHILKSPLSTFTRLMSTRKIFDDGIFSRSSLLK